MAIVYFDSSAFVKLFVEEAGSTLAIDLWNGCDVAVASRLAYAEVCSALAAADRSGSITASEHDHAQRRWDRYWAGVRSLELTRSVARSAGAKAREHSLSGADAVHLASALVVDDPNLVVATWDRRLAVAAAREQLAIAPRAPDR